MAHSVRCFVVQHCPLVDSMSHDPFDHIGTYFAVPWCGRLKRNSVWLTFSPHYELLFKCCILNVKHVTTYTFFLSLKIMSTPALLCTWLKWISCHPDECISLLKKKKKIQIELLQTPWRILKTSRLKQKQCISISLYSLCLSICFIRQSLSLDLS